MPFAVDMMAGACNSTNKIIWGKLLLVVFFAQDNFVDTAAVRIDNTIKFLF